MLQKNTNFNSWKHFFAFGLLWKYATTCLAYLKQLPNFLIQRNNHLKKKHAHNLNRSKATVQQHLFFLPALKADQKEKKERKKINWLDGDRRAHDLCMCRCHKTKPCCCTAAAWCGKPGCVDDVPTSRTMLKPWTGSKLDCDRRPRVNTQRRRGRRQQRPCCFHSRQARETNR